MSGCQIRSPAVSISVSDNDHCCRLLPTGGSGTESRINQRPRAPVSAPNRHAVLRRLRPLSVSPAARRQEVRGAFMGSAHGRNGDKSPRPDLVRDGPGGSYGRAISSILAAGPRILRSRLGRTVGFGSRSPPSKARFNPGPKIGETLLAPSRSCRMSDLTDQPLRRCPRT